MTRRLTRHVLVLAAALGAAVQLTAQQTGLTNGQLRQAALEVPRLMELLELQPGGTVADVGAGFGAWMAEFSRALGPDGRVYAVEIGQPQLKALRSWVEREKLTNVTVIEGGPQTTNLPAECCDGILIRDVYHHLTNPGEIVRSMAAALEPGGRLAVIDFAPEAGSTLPPDVQANRGGHGVPRDVVISEVSASLTHVQTIDPWPAPHQSQELYLVLFQKP